MMKDLVVLQRESCGCKDWLGGRVAERGRVLEGDDGEDTRRRLRSRGIDATNRAGRDRRLHEGGMGHVRIANVRRIGRGTAYFEWPINAIQRTAKDRHIHDCSWDTVSKLLTIVRFASSTLNTVPGTVNES